MQSSPKQWWEGPEPAAPTRMPDAGELAKMPSLAKPFAAFGAAAGLFAILALGSFRDAAREVSPLAPMLATAAAGAVAGVTLRGWRRLHTPELAREAVILWVAVIAALAGAASGGVVGLVTWGEDGFTRFAVGGAAVGLCFVPSVLVVFDAARRAARGRHGSLVAETDRRTVLSTVLAGVAFAGATQVPAILTANVSSALDPIVQVALSLVACLVATVGIVVLERRDRRARASLEGFAKDAAWLDRVEDADALPPTAVDLGIGAEHWTRTSDANYRVSGRAEVLVKGSIAEATAAFDECARRRHHALLVAACGLTAVSTSFALRLAVFL
jgi:F0F1-type ATP synthase assembly protein I